jgi:hypothetical protein
MLMRWTIRAGLALYKPLAAEKMTAFVDTVAHFCYRRGAAAFCVRRF